MIVNRDVKWGEEVSIDVDINTEFKLNKIDCSCSCTKPNWYKTDNGYNISVKTTMPKYTSQLEDGFIVRRKCTITYINGQTETINFNFKLYATN